MTDQPKPPLPVRSWRYLQRYGIRRLVRRVTDEVRTHSSSPDLAVQSDLPSAGIVEAGAEAILAHLDTPQSGAIETSSILLLSGWTCAPDRIERIESFVDGISHGSVQHGHARPDVANHLPRIPTAGSSGFLGEVDVSDLAHGPHLVEIAIEDSGGHRRVISAVFHTVADETLYRAFLDADQPSVADTAKLHGQIRARGGKHVVVWLEAPESSTERELTATIESLLGQAYDDWQCRVLAPENRHSALADLIARIGSKLSDRFEIVASNAFAEAESLAGAYSGVLVAGETLQRYALLRLAARAATERPRVVYSDHDTVDQVGAHKKPWLNPDWSPDYLLARNYVGGFYLFEDDVRVPALTADLNLGPAWRYDLLLHLTDETTSVSHEPHVLWSAAEITGAQATKTAAAELGVVRSCLVRRGSDASVEETSVPGMRRIRFPVNADPLVSIIVPTTGRLDYVQPLLASLEKTSYVNYELVFIDNSRGRNREGIALLRQHGARVIDRDEEFNWAKLNNDGAREARGDLLLFLNDDVEIIDPDWLTELSGQALRDSIGAVGCLLLYPDRRIQHAGVFFVDYGGGAVHLFRGLRPEGDVYLDLHRVQREVTAVTGACLMVRRSLFEKVGGFDERLAIAGNDIDLCLRLLSAGYRNIWTPHAVLIHHESVSRRDTSIVDDEARIWQLWGDHLRTGDRYHSPHFAKDRVDCAIDYRRLKGAAGVPVGVNLIGYIRAEMGVGEATRGVAAGLEAAGVPFFIVDFRHGNPSRMDDDSWARRVARKAIYDVNVIYVNADQTPAAFALLPAATFSGRYTIGGWTWELPEFPDDWLGSFAYVNEVWVPTEFVRASVAAKSPVPVVVIPHAVRAPSGPFTGRAALGLPRDRYLFLMMYDVHSVRERKNPAGAVEAFARAFAGDDPRVGMVIKVNNADRAERNLLRDLTRPRRNIHLIDRTLSRREVDSLIAACDCFVSLHRSEGFGLAMAEAMALGKPVIATNWSGNTDFMGPHNAACVDFRMVELTSDYGPYRSGQRWAEPDLNDAAEWMRTLANDPQRGLVLGESGRATIADGFSAAAVGGRIEQRLTELRQR